MHSSTDKYLKLRLGTIGIAYSLMFSSTVFADDNAVFDCLIKPEMYVELSSSVDGILDSVLVDKSDTVEKGQEVAKLESAVETATVELAQAKASLDSDIQLKQINLQFAKRNQKRIDELYKKKVASYNEKDEADTEYAQARMALKKARADKRIAELELQRVITQLNQKTVRSPISGVVVERLVMPGESVDERPILKLAQIDPLRVEVIAPTDLFGVLIKGMKAEIMPEVPAGAVYQATVSVVDKIIDAASGSFVVQMALPNPDHKVISGLKCKARFITENKKQLNTDELISPSEPSKSIELDETNSMKVSVHTPH